MQTFDLVVQIDQDGDPILTSGSKAGEAYLSRLRTALNPGDDVVICCTVEEFMTNTPRELVVGILNEATGETQKLCPPLLH